MPIALGVLAVAVVLLAAVCSELHFRKFSAECAAKEAESRAKYWQIHARNIAQSRDRAHATVDAIQREIDILTSAVESDDEEEDEVEESDDEEAADDDD